MNDFRESPLSYCVACFVLTTFLYSSYVESFFFSASTQTKDQGHINSSYQNLTTFPTSDYFLDLPEVKTLDLSYNYIQHIPIINISNAETVTALNLAHNKIKTITSYAFKNLVNLENLDLSYNELDGSHLKSETFEIGSFHKLKRISFQGNSLGYVEGFSFTSFEFLRLEYLDLSHCSLDILKDFSIDSLMRLKYLNLSYNHLSVIEDSPFTGLSELEVLDLSYNKLKVIQDIPLFHSLLYLNLDNNVINRIANNAFESAIKLQTLSLRRNNLRTMNHLTLPFDSLRELHLDDNPWSCDCRLRWVISDAGIDLKNKTSSIICTYPSMYRGRELFSLTPDELTCEMSFLGALVALILSATMAMIVGAGLLFLWRKRKEFRCFAEKGGNYAAVYSRDTEADEENATVIISDEKTLVESEEETQ